VFAEAFAESQVLRGSQPIVAFEQDFGDRDVHVGRSTQGFASRLRGRQFEGPPVGAHGVVQPALGAADVAEGDAAAKHIGERAVACQPVDGLGVGGVRVGEVAGGPRGQSGERAGRRSGVVVVGRGQ
jgi:hypothetical protein